MRTTKKTLHGFSIRLKDAGDRWKYTQKKLAEISGVNIKTIKRLENFDEKADPSPLARNLVNIAQALDVTPEYLLDGEENMNIFMNQLKDELKALSKDDIFSYHKQKLNNKVLAHLKLSKEFVDEIWEDWKDYKGIRCYSSYVQDTIIRYCHNRPKTVPAKLQTQTGKIKDS